MRLCSWDEQNIRIKWHNEFRYYKKKNSSADLIINKISNFCKENGFSVNKIREKCDVRLWTFPVVNAQHELELGNCDCTNETLFFQFNNDSFVFQRSDEKRNILQQGLTQRGGNTFLISYRHDQPSLFFAQNSLKFNEIWNYKKPETLSTMTINELIKSSASISSTWMNKKWELVEQSIRSITKQHWFKIIWFQSNW